ncbi:hypothetical protein ABZ793_30035 [Micromonospora sp. NPDC047465]|uniref:hypothetical protein n=1 Tax=Micromonospora sp. NPDC047465 TaxID=3154813 RepID=UPI003403CB82
MTGGELTVLVDRLRWDRRRDPYRGRREYSQTARQVAEECDRLVAEGRADLAVPVLREAVGRITRALMYLDDSSGIIGDDLQEFVRHPTAVGYRSLIDTVEAAGGDGPTAWALGVLRGRITQQPAYASALVDVLLAVGRDDQAWQEALHHGGGSAGRSGRPCCRGGR